MQNILDQMRALYPNLITAKTSIGNSVENRSIFMVKISDNPDLDEAEPEMFLNAVHHAREPIGMSQMIFFMWHLLENYNSNNDIKTLVNSTEIYFVPLVNPDGYVYNQTTNPSGGGLWRKNRKNNGNGTYGIDLNRNYGYKWGYDNTGSSPTSSSDTYRGTSAFSEPETQVLRDFCNNHNITLSFDYHAYGNYCIYPYSHVATNNNAELPLFQQMSNFLTAENGFISGNSNQTLAYLVNGGGNEWRYGEQTTKSKIYAFLPEVGTSTDGFWPASSRILPLCNSTIEMNLKGLKMSTSFAKATVNSNSLTSLSGNINYSIQNFSIKPTNYTVSLVPISAEIISVGSAKTYNGLALLQNQTDNISYTVDPSTAIGSVLQFELRVDNGLSVQSETVSVTYNCATAPASLATNLITNTNAQLNWAAVSGVSNYTVEYKASSSSTWLIANAANATTNLSLSGLTQGTTYDWRVKSNCTNGFSIYSQSQFSTTSPITYCTSKGNNSTLIYIDLVNIGTINRISGSDGGYYNGTALSTNALKGSSQTITFSSGFSSTTYRQYWSVWIDYNKNGVFTDAGEQVVNTNITGGGNGSANFVIPSTALTGLTRMRVASKNGSAPTSCQAFSYGEVEDYTLNITSSAARENIETILAENIDKNSINIFPNPASDMLSINLGKNATQIINMKINSINGINFYNQTTNFNSEKIEINVKNLTPGIYFLNFEFKNSNKKIFKFLKQ
jgi:Zinc carboxypeptidase/GEVED domain/Secretion system C-terminal sorting domain/Fibronectin type III domain